MRYVLSILLMLSGKLFACSDLHWDWDVEQWIEGSHSIYHGMVVSISLDKQAIYDGETDSLLNAISLTGDKYITLKIFESLKGSKKAVAKVVLPECLGGAAEFGDSAILFEVDNIWHIKPLNTDMADDMALSILNKLSKVKHTSER